MDISQERQGRSYSIPVCQQSMCGVPRNLLPGGAKEYRQERLAIHNAFPQRSDRDGVQPGNYAESNQLIRRI